MRTFCIGDIHGSLKGLIQVLELSQYDYKTDNLIFLGDYVDGWSESAEVIQFILDLKSKIELLGRHKDSIICIRGNHDEWCNEWMKTSLGRSAWLTQGGQSTVDSYVRTGHITSDDHKKFFRGLYNYYVDEKNKGFVHGGFTSSKGLGHEKYQKSYYWDRDLWKSALIFNNTDSKKLIKYKGYKKFSKHTEIFIGHTSTGNWKCKPHYQEYHNPDQLAKNGPIVVPMNRCNVWNLDTGAGFEGRLTIMDIDTKEYWQSEMSKDLYKGEEGR